MERLWRPEAPAIEPVFDGNFTTGIVKAPSGAVLDVESTATAVCISDSNPDLRLSNKDPIYYLRACIQENLASEPWTLRFNVRTRDPRSDRAAQRHPDLHARWFVARVICYFQQVHDREVGTIAAEWHNSSKIGDNFMQYAQALGDAPPASITQEQMNRAAEVTWTGTLARDLGYDRVFVRAGRYLTAGKVLTDFCRS